AYKEMANRRFGFSSAGCTRAALGDVGLTFWIYAVGALSAGKFRWGLSGARHLYCALAVLAAVHAAWFEQSATASGRWSYSERMPIVPVLKVGLWPLLQLTVLTPLVASLSRCFVFLKPARLRRLLDR